MRTVVALSLLLATPAFAEAPPKKKAAPKPCSAAEHRQFDFWVGAWTVKLPDGKVAGTNTIEKILDGCVLRESWKGTKGSVGHSFNVYAKGKWHQTWVDNRGTLLELVGGLDAKGRMVMSQDTVDPQGKKVRHEISWTKQGDGSVKQHWRTSNDGGKTWKDLFVGIYTRR